MNTVRPVCRFDEDFKVAPTLAEIRAETDQRVSAVRSSVLQMIRTQMPVDALFVPKLNLNLDTFINDQILLREVALFLNDLPPSDPDQIATHMAENPLLDRLKAAFNPDFLPLFYEACADVSLGKPIVDRMRDAIEGRVFTTRNALTAQKNPAAVYQTQTYKKQSHKAIQEEGAAFIRQCLAIHLKWIKDPAVVPFENELISVAKQLVPFVRLVTLTHLRDYPEYTPNCPDEPLTFRDPTGYNRHGLIAAAVMQIALEVLGFKTRLMNRCDLEPKATQSTTHNIVEVTDPFGESYVVDPAYMQFHKDVCISEDNLPKEPVLVINARHVREYVEKTIMPEWRKNRTLALQNSISFMEKLRQNDQICLYLLDHATDLPIDIIPEDMEAWVLSSMCRPWDLSSYHPILADNGLQEILHGVNPKHHRAHDLVKGMGIGALTTLRPYQEITHRLDALIEMGEKNAPEALALIARLPRALRAEYRMLLDLDPRTTQLDPCINAYFRSIAKVVNPKEECFRVLYGCSGADATSVLESTNANELLFVDLTEVPFDEFQTALAILQKPGIIEAEQERQEKSSNFMTFRLRYGGAQSCKSAHKHFMEHLSTKLFIDLNAIGVDLAQVKLTALEDGAVRLDFPWEYHGSSGGPKMRSLTFMTADITNPETYPPLLQRALKEGIDAFFMKGAFVAPKHYSRFLPIIAKGVKDSGWLMTSDKTFLMDTFDPEACLGNSFARVNRAEPMLLSELMQPPFDPFLRISLLSSRAKPIRTPGTDISYWARLNLRQKIK